MSVITDAWEAFLRLRPLPAAPSSSAELVSEYPSNAAAARVLSGLPSSGRLPAKGTDARRSYEAHKRAVQRAGEGRPLGPGRSRLLLLRSPLRAPLRALNRATNARRRAALRKGIQTRLSVMIKDSQGVRLRVLPAGYGGLHFDPGGVGGLVDLYDSGDLESLEAVYLGMFVDDYGWDFFEEDETAQIIDCKLWVTGDREPV